MVAVGSAMLRDAMSGSKRCASCAVHARPACTARAFTHTQPSRKRCKPIQLASRPSVACSSTSAQLQSETELFLDNLEQETDLLPESALRSQLQQLEHQVGSAGATDSWIPMLV